MTDTVKVPQINSQVTDLLMFHKLLSGTLHWIFFFAILNASSSQSLITIFSPRIQFLLMTESTNWQQSDVFPGTDMVLRHLFSAQHLHKTQLVLKYQRLCTSTFHLALLFPPGLTAGQSEYHCQKTNKLPQCCLSWSERCHENRAFQVFKQVTLSTKITLAD